MRRIGVSARGSLVCSRREIDVMIRWRDDVWRVRGPGTRFCRRRRGVRMMLDDHDRAVRGSEAARHSGDLVHRLLRVIGRDIV